MDLHLDAAELGRVGERHQISYQVLCYQSHKPRSCSGTHISQEVRGGSRDSGWPSRPAGGLGPVAGDAASMPSQQSSGGDDPAGSSVPGERGCDGVKQGPATVVDRGSVDLAA